MNKSDVRKKAKEIRKNCSLSENDKKQFQDHLFSILLKRKVISGYNAYPSEFNPSFLVPFLQQRRCTYVVPDVVKDTRVLNFLCQEGCKQYNPDVFLVPLLAFDEEGCRIGYGGGYYDTTLAHYREMKDIIAIGIAYEAQKWPENLPVEAHDEKMDFIVTEKKVRCF